MTKTNDRRIPLIGFVPSRGPTVRLSAMPSQPAHIRQNIHAITPQYPTPATTKPTSGR